MFSSVNLSSPLSLYSIPVVWFTAFYPNAWKFSTINNTIGYDNVQPRSNTAKFSENKNISPRLAAKVQRMEGAHLNGNEAFPLWTAAILAANIAGLDNALMNKVSLAYIGLRVLFNQVYINQETVGTSWFRTAVFFASNLMPMTLLIRAAQKLAAER
ncbi:hypothetical protein P691DRAFT_732772 [Macrolepiota fuliginosa MF-IS2]|uniref:Uncharacterized protein n=1 Tax=Macrolepiota fuliginosa MF-IS2 TaxID=1400762 RepID=A0A9P5X8Y6_9AGAR|nr:hypothetical protein P691DRAFT_732772 [Macrolepiota fuliginosa MF-IS2]